jgi:transposase-like protein
MRRSTRYPRKMRERAVRMVTEHRGEHPSEWAAMCSIASKFGMSTETLRKWVRRTEVEDPQSRLSFFCAGARPATAQAVTFITTNRARWGIEPICRVLSFAPATYYAALARPPSARRVRDEALIVNSTPRPRIGCGWPI